MRSLNLVYYSVIAFVILTITWLSLATVDQAIRMPGEIEPQGYVQTTQARYPGRIASIHVVLDDSVSKGSPLIEFDRQESEASLRQNQIAADQLRVSLARLLAESRGTQPAFEQNFKSEIVEAERLLFSLRQESLMAQLATIDSEYAVTLAEKEEALNESQGLRSALALKREEERLIAPLVEIGAEPKLRLMGLEQAIQELNNRLSQIDAKAGAYDAKLQTIKSRRLEVVSNAKSSAYQEWVQGKERLEALLEEQKVLQLQLDSMVVRAPFDGVVTKVYPKGEGAVVGAGDPLVEIVPLRSKGVMIRGKLAPKDLAAITLGQECRISLGNYDFTTHGNLSGKIVKVAQNTTKEESGSSYYEIVVETTSDRLDKSGVVPRLAPGMLVDIAAVGETRTVLDYLLKPLQATAERSFIE